MSKQKPILFSTPMVQAIIAGSKTVTRRIMKTQIPPCDHQQYVEAPWKDDPTKWYTSDGINWCCALCGNGTQYSNQFQGIKSPVQPGDILWVRETWRKYFQTDEFGYTDFSKELIEFKSDNPPMIYQIDCDGSQEFNKDGTEKFIPWKPSIFMPKSAARIWLEIVSVRPERLQDITEEDAVREGIEDSPFMPTRWKMYSGSYDMTEYPVTSFASLWESINGPESWDANPWVWRIEFKVLSTTGKPDNL